MNMRIVKTLMKKDLQNCIKNKNLLISMVIPIFFCVLYNYVFKGMKGIRMMSGEYVLQMCTVFSIAIVPTTILPMMIAEEKEKYTLRSLMLAGVGGTEFLASKLAVCMGLTVFDALLVFFLAGGRKGQLPIFIVLVLLCSLGLCFLGAVTGLIAKDQTTAGNAGTPLLLLTMIPPVFSAFGGVIEKIAVIVPTTSFQTVFLSVSGGGKLTEQGNLTAFLVCAAWIAAGYVVFRVFYKRKGVDC